MKISQTLQLKDVRLSIWTKTAQTQPYKLLIKTLIRYKETDKN